MPSAPLIKVHGWPQKSNICIASRIRQNRPDLWRRKPMHITTIPRDAASLSYDVKAFKPVHTVLFVCGKNKWRSPTAEHIFADHPGVQCASAGVSRDAEIPVSVELIEWAQIIFVMERSHKAKLTQSFKPELRGKPVVCLNIPDKYKYMDDILVKLLKKKVTPHLPSLHRSRDH